MITNGLDGLTVGQGVVEVANGNRGLCTRRHRQEPNANPWWEVLRNQRGAGILHRSLSRRGEVVVLELRLGGLITLRGGVHCGSMVLISKSIAAISGKGRLDDSEHRETIRCTGDELCIHRVPINL